MTAIPSQSRYYARAAFHQGRDLQAIGGDDSGARLSAKLGSEALLAAMLRYYAEHHPQATGLAISGCERDRARAST